MKKKKQTKGMQLLDKDPEWLQKSPPNMPYQRHFYFRGLRGLDIENLMCGRFTWLAITEAKARVQSAMRRDPLQDEDTMLADELNDMLEAAR